MIKIWVLDKNDVLPQSIKNEAHLIVRFRQKSIVGPIFDIENDRFQEERGTITGDELSKIIAEYVQIR